MACSNFCSLSDFQNLSAHSPSRQERDEKDRLEYQAITKAEARYRAYVHASTAGADPVYGSIEQQIAGGGADIVTATLGLAVISAALSAPITGLIDAISGVLDQVLIDKG